MKKYLKILSIFTLLFFNMKVIGQGSTGWNNFILTTFTDLHYHVIWNEETNEGHIDDSGGQWGYGPGNPNDPNTGNRKTFMTYNINKRNYGSNGTLIKNSAALFCAVQEVFFWNDKQYDKLKNNSNLEGKYFMVLPLIRFGIAILYHKGKFGDPINVVTNRIWIADCNPIKGDQWRGYIICEFGTLIFACTHLGGSGSDKADLIDLMLNENIIKNSAKPIYIAGDMNFDPINHPTLYNKFLAKGFEVMNSLEGAWKKDSNGNFVLDDNGNKIWVYDPAHQTTYDSKKMIDLIFKKASNYEVIEKGIPSETPSTDLYSDHKPYRVRVDFVSP